MLSRILIVGHTNIGDICYDLSVLPPLRTAFPQSRLSLLTSSAVTGLIEGHPELEQVLLFNRHAEHKGWWGRLKLIRMIRRQRFDGVIMLKTSWMHLFLGARNRWVLKRRHLFDPSGRPLHRADSYLKLLREHGVRADQPIFRFPIGEADRAFADEFLKRNRKRPGRPLVGISPLANWALKCWSPRNWNRLIERMEKETGAEAIVFGKSSADPFAQRMVRELSPGILSAIDRCTLKQAAALIERCALFIAPDTGLLHLASCLKVPCVGLYGATPVTHVIPYGQREGLVPSTAQLTCMPCSTNPKTFAICGAAGGEAPCMEAISVERVLEKAKERLGTGGAA